MKNALIIFVRKPELGKVKTRLAATLGDDRALEIYIQLLQHTREVALATDCDRYLFTTGEIAPADWPGFHMEKQSTGDLGSKMFHAFSFLFEKNYEKVVIIGSDCLELSANHVHQAFTKLAGNDVVIGPAYDGGYYLLGMRKMHAEIFYDKDWGNDSVFYETVQSIHRLGIQREELEMLNDVDEEKDLPEYLRL